MISARLSKLFLIVVSAGMILVFQNCSAVLDPENDPYLGQNESTSIDTGAILSSLQKQKDQILSEKCMNCYATELGSGSILSIDDLVNAQLVVRGSPETSRLYLDAVDGIIPPAPVERFTAYEINILADWISAEGNRFDTYIGGTPIDTGGSGAVVTFADVRSVLQNNCVSCHSGANPPRLDGDAQAVRSSLYQGVAIVVPRNADASRLYQSFARMPRGGPLGINSSQAIVVRSWINAGAQ